LKGSGLEIFKPEPFTGPGAGLGSAWAQAAAHYRKNENISIKKIYISSSPGYKEDFEGRSHGFAVRGDLSDPQVKTGKEGVH
jgi:hypothetical protein